MSHKRFVVGPLKNLEAVHALAILQSWIDILVGHAGALDPDLDSEGPRRVMPAIQKIQAMYTSMVAPLELK